MKIALTKDVPTPVGDADDVVWTAEHAAKYGNMGQNYKRPGQWDIPFPVGQKFNVHWQYGIDWTNITVLRSRMFRESDLGFTLRFNHTDRRDEFIVNRADKMILNTTVLNTDLKLTAPSVDNTAQEFGTHKKEDLNKNEWTVLVNGKIEDRGYTELSTLKIGTVRCTGGC